MSQRGELSGIPRGAGSYVDRILSGATAGDLAVERPTTFELVISFEPVINGRTAWTLRTGVPPVAALAQAGKVLCRCTAATRGHGPGG